MKLGEPGPSPSSPGWSGIVGLSLLLIGFLLLCLFTVNALGHEHWISHGKLYDPQSGSWCCNEKDCEDITQQGILVTEKLNGYIISDTAEYVSASRVLWQSPDGHWWRCHILTHEMGRSWKKARCLIGPPPST